MIVNSIFARSKKEFFFRKKLIKKHQYEMSIMEIKYNFL